jgi:hypothetical protein
MHLYLMGCHVIEIIIADKMFIRRERDLMPRRGERGLQIRITELGKGERSQCPESAVLIMFKVWNFFHPCRRNSVRDIWQERFELYPREKDKIGYLALKVLVENHAAGNVRYIVQLPKYSSSQCHHRLHCRGP